MANCEKHGEYTPEILSIPAIKSGYMDGSILRPEYTIERGCPACIAEGEQEAEERRTKAEAQQREEDAREAEAKRRAHFAAMNIEPAFYEASLDGFDAFTPELKHNLSRVQDLVAGKITKIVMTGKNGTGKTHLACAALNILGGRIMSMYEISTTIRASYTAMARETELEIVDELARLPLLVIDEIGRTKGGDAEQNWLSYLIDKRHTRGLPLILISNKHTRKTCPANGCADCLENYIGEDIMSRLNQGGALLKFTGEDYRKRKLVCERG